MKKNSEILMARSLRLAIIQQQYEAGNLTEEEAIELLTGPLTPGDNSTIFDDSDQLVIKPSDTQGVGIIEEKCPVVVVKIAEFSR